MKVKTLLVVMVGLLILATLPFMGACAEETAPAPAAPTPATPAPAPSGPQTITPTTPTTPEPAKPAPEKVIELTYNLNYNFVMRPGKAAVHFADVVKERSNGRVEITVYPSGALTPPAAVYEGVVSGISDLGLHSVAHSPGRFPVTEATHLPLPIQSAYTCSRASHDFIANFMPEEFNDVHFLFAGACGPYNFASVTDTPVLTPADLEGQRIRAAGDTACAIAEAYSGAPISMPMSEVYEGASKGMLDVLLVPLETQKGWKHAELTTSITLCPLKFTSTNVTVINLETWNSLPDDIRKLLDDLGAEYAEEYANAWWYADIEALDYFLSMGEGRKLITPPKEDLALWADPLTPIIDAYIAKVSAQGLPGAEYVKYAQERCEYWNERHPDEESCKEWAKEWLLLMD